MIRLAIALLIFISLSTATMAVDFRWTQGFGQGTVEARIQNENDSSVSVDCPSGSLDTTPGLSIQTGRIRFRPGEQVPVQIIVDGVNYPFVVSDPSNSGSAHLDFRAHGRAARQGLESLVRALIRSRQQSFIVEFPRHRHVERFSLRDVRRTLMAGRKTILDGC